MKNNNTENKVTWKGWASLIALIVILSGIFNSSEGALAAFDYNNLVGSFGTIVDGVTFTGKGGVGVKAGFMIGLTLIPGVMFCRGLVAVVQELGGLQAAGVLFRPILRPLLGIPGTAGLAFVSSFTGSDIAALLTRDLHDDGYITDDERTVFVAYQYAASAIIDNTINAGAPLAAISPLAVGPIILIEIISKIFGANIVRLVIKISNSKAKKEAK
ncbi:MAG: hypothetical protein ACRDA3_09700 [Peptostreptococcaceae bacterium]